MNRGQESPNRRAPDPQPRPTGAPQSGRLTGPRLRPLLKLLGLALLVGAVYAPALRGGFVWDDTVLIDRNSLVQGRATLRSIWFGEDFPLSIVAFWLQWRMWGKDPAGYHAVNVLLHALGALLTWRLLHRLKVPGAWLAAALFAVHPVAVASVAWVSELKNTLSLPFFLLSLHGYLRSEGGPSRSETGQPVWAWRDGLFYGLSLGAFVLALLSKTSTVMLPVVLLACAWWQRGRIQREDVMRTAPFFALALAAGVMTVAHHRAMLGGEPASGSDFAARLAGAGRALWFYLGKALCPVNLAMIYPRWQIAARNPAAWLPLLLWGAWLGFCWTQRRHWGRHALAALGSFTALLFPVLGVFDMYHLTISPVADHFAYLALLPVMALVAAAGCRAGGWLTERAGQRRAGGWQARLGPGAGWAAVLALAVLARQRAGVLADEERLWRDTLARSPAAWVAHNNLGCLLAEQNRLGEAVRHFQAALAVHPRHAAAHRNLGRALTLQGRWAEAAEHLRAAVRLNPTDAEAWRALAAAYEGLRQPGNAVRCVRQALRLQPDAATRLQLAGLLRATGDLTGAVDQLRRALAARPDSAEGWNNLAWLLATAPQAELRDGPEAVRCAERACALTDYRQARMVGTLAAAYAAAGRFEEAVDTARRAIELALAAGDPHFAAANRQLLRLYEARRPYHEPAQQGPSPGP